MSYAGLHMDMDLWEDRMYVATGGANSRKTGEGGYVSFFGFVLLCLLGFVFGIGCRV